jgi:hypothetical protein
MQVGPITQATTIFSLSCTGAEGTSPAQSITITATETGNRFFLQQSWDAVNDVIWDPLRQVLYLAIGSNGDINPNSVTAFDPETGTITATIVAGSEPNALSMSAGGQYLYVGFAGADVVNRYLLPGLTLDATIPVNPSNRVSHGEPTFASQVVVAPGAPLTVAVVTQDPQQLPPTALFNVFDDQTPRPPAVGFGGNYLATSLTWGADDTKIFGGELNATVDYYSTTPAVTTLLGTAVPPVLQGLNPFSISGTTTYNSGIVYNSNGYAFDANTMQVLGNFQTAGLVTVDAANKTVFVASWKSTAPVTIASYDLGQYTPRETITVTEYDVVNEVYIGPGLPKRLVRWGPDGLAIVDYSGHLAILWGPFVASGGTDTPVGKLAGSNPCCSQNPLQFSPTVSMTSITANDVVWDSTHGMLFAAIPSTDANHPNTIAVVNTTTGQATTYIATAANPGALAVSDDGQFLYVGEAGEFQRFLLPSLALDLTASFNFSLTYNTTLPPTQMVVQPGAPHTVTATFTTGLSAAWYYIFDDGIQRVPQFNSVTTFASWLQWSADGKTLYGFNSISGFDLWAADPTNFATATPLGAPFAYPFSINAGGPPYGMTFTAAGGLLYGDTGAIFDPATGGWPGTLPVSIAVGALDALGTFTIDTARNRAYADVCADFGDGYPCFNYLTSFNLSTYTPVAIGVLQGIGGRAYRVQELGPTSFAVLTSTNQLVFVSSSRYAQ